MSRNLVADPAQLDELGRRFDMEALSLNQLGDLVAERLINVEWFGPDADQIREEWNSHCRGQFFGLADVLRTMAQQLRQHAEQQRQASSGQGEAIAWPPPGLPVMPLGPYPLPLNTLNLVLDGIDLAQIAGKLFGLEKHIPEELWKVLRKMPGFDGFDFLSEYLDHDLGGMIRVGLEYAVMPALIAAFPIGTGIALGYTAATMLFPEFEEFVEGGLETVVYEGGKLIAPVVGAIAAPIAQGVQTAVEVAAPIVEGAMDMAGDAIEAGGKVVEEGGKILQGIGRFISGN